MGIPLTLSSVPAATPYIQYIATNGQTVFPYPFVITQDSDLVVVVNGVTLNTDTGYTLSGQGNSTGGNVTFTLGQTAGAIVTLFRNIVIQRVTQISQNSGFSSTAFNAEYNNIYLILQQLQESIGLSLQVAITNNPAPVTTLTPGAYANKFLSFDANGNPTPAVLTSSGALTAAIITALTQPQTPAEASAGIIPTTTLYGELDLRRYGFIGNGVANDYTAINSAILVAQQYSTARITFPQNATALCNTGLTWDVNKVAIDLNGTTLSFVNLASGVALTPFTSQTNQNLSALTSNVHPLQNGVLIGPGVTITATIGMVLNTGGATTLAGLVFRNLSFREFSTDIALQSNTFCLTFDNCLFTLTSGVATTYSITQILGAGNNGERNTFRDCFWYNKQFGIQNTSGACDMYIRGGSMDGCVTAVSSSGGAIFLDGCHIEAGTDTANWFIATGSAAIYILNLEIVLDTAKTAFPMFYSDVAVTNGGIFIDNVFLGGAGMATYTAADTAHSSAFGPVLIGGTGNCLVRNLAQGNTLAHPPTSGQMNWLAYPGFESPSYVNEWTLTGGAVRTGAQFHTGTQSLSLPAIVGTNSVAVTSTPCKPGQYAQGNFWYLLPAIVAAGGQLAVALAYSDKAGTGISTSSFSITVNNAGWLNAGVKLQAPAPPGTVSATLTVQTAVTTGPATGYIDDVLLTVV